MDCPKIIQGDCLEALKQMDNNSIDSIVTDPPYGINFMGKKWDYDIPGVTIWRECLRVLKPGGHILVACGTRTQHRMAVNIEDAGFEIRDLVAWIYGSGFPKSHNIGKAIKATYKTGGSAPRNLRQSRMGKDYKPTGQKDYRKGRAFSSDVEHDNRKEKVNNNWEGWGTALKPAMELWTLARKPISEKTIAKNVLKWGTGGINVDGCRVPLNGDKKTSGGCKRNKTPFFKKGNKQPWKENNTKGRYPANLIHDGSDEVERGFPDVGKSRGGRINKKQQGDIANVPSGNWRKGNPGFGDSGSASRFFYCAKASKRERNFGLDGFEEQQMECYGDDKNNKNTPRDEQKKTQNNHPTVKPVKLMKYLVNLITPPEGTVLDPFMGTGTTGMACKELGFDFIGIEREAEYCKIAKARIEAWAKQRDSKPIYDNQLSLF